MGYIDILIYSFALAYAILPIYHSLSVYFILFHFFIKEINKISE